MNHAPESTGPAVAVATPAFPQAISSLPLCPPGDATAVEGVVYRVTRTSPSTIEDMKTHEEAGKMKGHPDKCGRCGLSVILDEEDLDLFHEKYPRIGNYVAKATLAPEHGKIKVVRGVVDSHSNVWFYEHIPPESRLGLFDFHRAFTS